LGNSLRSWNWYSPHSTILTLVSPANPSYTEEELLHQLTDSNAKAILTIPELLDVAIAAGKRANIPLEKIILFKEASRGHKLYTELSSIKLAESTRGKINPEDVAFLAYSSGTTGLAKGVMLTHRNIVSNSLMGAYLEGMAMSWKTDKMISFVPFYHI
jgi:4-coumarate--CoA ligase